MNEEIRSIIIEALEDYKRWFKDIEMTETDKEKVKLINKGIKYIKKLI